MALVRKPTTKKNNHSQDNTIDAKNFVLIPCTFRGCFQPLSNLEVH